MDSFRDGSSHVSFIGKRSLEEVQRRDASELEEIRGSFEAIAQRQEEIIGRVKSAKPRVQTWVDLLFQPIEEQLPLGFKMEDYIIAYITESSPRLVFPDKSFDTSKFGRFFPHKEVYSKLEEIGKNAIIPGERNIDLFLESPRFLGGQNCPFDVCSVNAGSNFYRIRHIPSGRLLSINAMTSHLSKVHNLLEKDNEYGIGAREFYDLFMSD